MLSSNAPITWGQLLTHLPQCQLDKLMQAVKPATPAMEDQVPANTAELAAVHAAVTAHLEGNPPENMFAPFTIPPKDSQGKPTKHAAPTVHWGNVDTGSMVNIVYSGVLNTHPGLEEY